MMQIYKCDKCGKYIDSNDDRRHATAGYTCKGEFKPIPPTLDLLTRLVEVKGKDGHTWELSNCSPAKIGFVVVMICPQIFDESGHQIFFNSDPATALIEAYNYCKDN